MTEQKSELREVQAAGAVVLEEAGEAFRRGEMSDHVMLGFRLATVAHMMKLSHQPGAFNIVREYCDAVGLEFDVLDEQIQARIYQQVQIARMENGLGEDAHR